MMAMMAMMAMMMMLMPKISTVADSTLGAMRSGSASKIGRSAEYRTPRMSRRTTLTAFYRPGPPRGLPLILEWVLRITAP
jgi:hypothetical protein